MIWLLWFTIAQEPVDVRVLKGSFDTEQACQDAMIAHTIAAGFAGEEFKSAGCEVQQESNEG